MNRKKSLELLAMAGATWEAFCIRFRQIREQDKGRNVKQLCILIVIALLASNAHAQQTQQARQGEKFLTWDLVAGITVTAATATTAWTKDRDIVRLSRELDAIPGRTVIDDILHDALLKEANKVADSRDRWRTAAIASGSVTGVLLLKKLVRRNHSPSRWVIDVDAFGRDDAFFGVSAKF